LGDEAGRIEPRLSAFDTTMAVVSLVIGIGIFRTPAVVASRVGTSAAFFAAWGLGGVVSLIGALTFAEIGSRCPRAGGYYKVVAECYHPSIAFMLNWSQVLMQGAGAAGVAFIGVEYLLPLLLPAGGRGPGPVLAAALILMSVLLGLNLLGVRAGARTQNLLSLLKIAMILALAAAAFLARPSPGAAAPPPVRTAEGGAAPSPAAAGLIAAAVAVFYAYGGYQNTMNLGGDARRPRRSLPLAITAGMTIVTGLYLLINVAYHRALGLAGIAGSDLVAADLARACFGHGAEAVVSVAIFLSAAGFVNATILHVTRSYLAMAEDRLLPGFFRRVDPRTQAQRDGLLFFGATMLLPAFALGSFEKLLSYVIFTDTLMLVVVASTVFVLRRRGAGSRDPGVFRLPGYPLLPTAFIASLLAVNLYLLVHDTRLSLWGIGVLLAGGPLYVLMRRSQGPAAPAAASGAG
jgi:APA family basic amino acid/polyamine antiporter